MKVPHINCIACDAQIDGPFEPPHALPPERCPECGEKPTLSVNKDTLKKELEALGKLTGDPELVEQLKQALKAARSEEKPPTVDLVEKVVEAYRQARSMMRAEQAGVAVSTGLSELLWRAWHRTAEWKHHKGMLN